MVGQTIVIQYPERTYVVRSGDTLFSIAQANGLTVKTLLRNNPSLAGEDRIFPGQELVLAYRQEKQGTLTVNGYAYPTSTAPCSSAPSPISAACSPSPTRPPPWGSSPRWTTWPWWMRPNRWGWSPS